MLDLAQMVLEASRENVKASLSHVHGSRACLAMVTGDAEKCYFHALARVQLEEALQLETNTPTAQLASAYNDLGSALSRNKLYSQAEPLLLQSKRVREGLPGFQKSWNFSPRHELGVTNWLQGRFDEAAQVLLQALHERAEALGYDDHESQRSDIVN
jgi:tetratricopeptide (TPR) repeat protein